jgi:hypothetical protein
MDMKTLIFVLLLWPCLLNAQSIHVRVSISPVVDTADHDIASVITLWESYLNSNPDSVYANPYWVETEQHQYNPFDLVGHTYYNPSLYSYIHWWRAEILSVSPIDSVFVIRTMFYSLVRNDSSVNVACIIQTAARRENGLFKLCNALMVNTRYWHREQVGNIKFVFPPEHLFNRAFAERMYAFVDSLARVWQVKLVPIEYYFADDFGRVAKALGFDYLPSEGNVSGPRGFTDTKNRIIYSGGSNEWYPHEFVHILVNPLYPNINPYFAEGYATLLGGSRGQDLLWHIRRNYEYLKDHLEVDVVSFKGVDAYVDSHYFIGGLLCKMAEEKGGLPLIQKLMTYGRDDEDLYRAIQDTFGVRKADVNIFLRAKLAQYAQ